jgi:dihydroxyacid dehydratase/phosphogluconate dehydratase
VKELADPVRLLSDGVIDARKRTLGFGRDDLSKPVVAIINAYSELNLAHLGFNAVAQRVREGVLAAGGRPVESGMLALCDAMAHGRLHEKYVLPGRDLIADAIETYINAHGVFDAMVCVGTCDKVLPAMLIAAVRVDIPTVIVTGGPAQRGEREHQPGRLRAYRRALHQCGRRSHGGRSTSRHCCWTAESAGGVR